MIIIMYIRTNIHGYRVIKYLKKNLYIYIFSVYYTSAKLQKEKSHPTIHYNSYNLFL